MINDEGLTLDSMDVRNQFGTKYNRGLIQMFDYAKTLQKYRK